ncbi:Uu.00g068150.m01.CDS01 [Anthostomella pinea]|uniref:Uu.00g068150.m01.CDS01 n=1 Tax=Anthostomella pinea TaxID=933095 RepID=A0AAI8VV45_9PEZI|nr:Uu.00g068150.m01.CDS01 [Anthostomella pinea]
MALDEAHKDRLKAHMNKEHAPELQQYLRAFNGLSTSASARPQLTGLTLDFLTIASASGTHTVPIAPPMSSLADARVRFVDMAQRAHAQLGLSDIGIESFTRPRGLGVVSFVGVSFYFVCAAATLGFGLVRPGTAVWELLDAGFPYGGDGFVWLVKAIFVPVLAIHLTEAWWLARTRLAKHGVETGSKLWWTWVADTFLEGYPAMMRFDSMVAEERRRRESAKH